MKYKNLATISKDSRPATFLKLGMKSIVIKDYPRKLEAYMVLPSVNGEDSKCRLLYKRSADRCYRSTARWALQQMLLKDYPDAERV